MKFKALFFACFLVIVASSAQAGFMSDLFGTSKPEPKITQEEAQIVEDEEVISAHEYLGSTPEASPQEAERPPENVLEPLVEEPQIFDEKPNSLDSGASEQPSAPLIFEKSEAFEETPQGLEIQAPAEDLPLVRAQTIFLSFAQKPDKVYLAQHVPIRLRAVITQENPTAINTTFINAKNVEVLNKNAPWVKGNDNSYEANYTVKFLSTAGKMADFKVTATFADQKPQSELLPALTPKVVALREDVEFCRVLANNFILESNQAKKYDETSNIVVLEASVTDGNIEDFHLPYAIRDGIDDIKEVLGKRSIYYYAIIPNTIQQFKFKYFDLVSNKYQVVTFPIILLDNTVSTQTDLNPQKSKFSFYKMVAFIVLAFLLFLLYMKYKKIYWLVFSLLLGAYTLYAQFPIRKLTLEKGVALRILPMQNSTVFYKTEQAIDATVLDHKAGFVKVLLPNKKIGWVDEALTKN